MKRAVKDDLAVCEKIIATGKQILAYGRDYRFIPDNYQLEPTEIVKYCPKCGQGLDNKLFNFCPWCGNQIEGGETDG